MALTWAVRTLVGIVWLSSGIFSLYILAFFIGGVVVRRPGDWNDSLPGLYVPGEWVANVGIGVHFLLGAILLILGPIQLIGGFRERYPAMHRRIGWVYAVSALVTGVGGIAFIGARGTIGRDVMDIGFGLYGLLMVVFAVLTVRNAVVREIAAHRAWAIRLYALAIGSWIYRMDYGFWMLFMGRTGRTETFDGPFDVFMIFWFYLPNLVVAEVFIRARGPRASAAGQIAAAALLGSASAFLLAATGFFTWFIWGPTILYRFGLGS